MAEQKLAVGEMWMQFHRTMPLMIVFPVPDGHIFKENSWWLDDVGFLSLVAFGWLTLPKTNIFALEK